MSIMKWIQRITKRRNKGYTEGERVMKLVIQRCQEASVSVNGKTVGAIEKGSVSYTHLDVYKRQKENKGW